MCAGKVDLCAGMLAAVCLRRQCRAAVQQRGALVSAGIAIGGDTFPGSTLSDHCIRYQNIPQIKMIVVLGELGGTDEYSLVNALKAGALQRRNGR